MADTHDNRPRVARKGRRRYRPLPFILVCAAIIICLSFLFRVNTIEVIGSIAYTDEEIITASGIEVGDNLFFVNRSSAASRIKSQLPAVGGVYVDRTMPSKIIITIEESDAVVYTSIGDELWSLDKNLKYIDKLGMVVSSGMIQLKGIELQGPIIGTQAETDKYDKITAALELIIKYNMLRSVAWLDVSSDTSLEFEYLDRFTIRIPAEGDMDYNFQKLLSAVAQLGVNDRALIDLTIDDKVHISPR